MPIRRSMLLGIAAFTVANVVTLVAGVLLPGALGVFNLAEAMQGPGRPLDDWVIWLSIMIVAVVPTTALAVAGLLFAQPHIRLDTETRCRRCAHILRYIVKPECPECGEKI